MKINLFVPKTEIIPIEVPDEMMTNIIFDNCKANFSSCPTTAITADRDDYTQLIKYILEHYNYAFADDFDYAEAETANGELVPVLEILNLTAQE